MFVYRVPIRSILSDPEASHFRLLEHFMSANIYHVTLLLTSPKSFDNTPTDW